MGALLEAYMGYYEDDREFTDSLPIGLREDPTGRELLREWAEKRINEDTPKQRLKIYCTWNGILGYSDVLYDIAVGNIGKK